MQEKDIKIARPYQIYKGYVLRDYVGINQRTVEVEATKVKAKPDPKLKRIQSLTTQ